MCPCFSRYAPFCRQTSCRGRAVDSLFSFSTVVLAFVIGLSGPVLERSDLDQEAKELGVQRIVLETTSIWKGTKCVAQFLGLNSHHL